MAKWSNDMDGARLWTFSGSFEIEYIDEEDRPQHFSTSVATERKCIVTFFGPLTLYTACCIVRNKCRKFWYCQNFVCVLTIGVLKSEDFHISFKASSNQHPLKLLEVAKSHSPQCWAILHAVTPMQMSAKVRQIHTQRRIQQNKDS